MAEVFTRKAVSSALAVTYQRVVQLEKKGLLVRVPGVSPAVYTDASVQALVDERRLNGSSGDDYAKAFALFREGKTPVDVVIALKIPPHRATALLEAFCIADKSFTIPLRVIHDIEAEVGCKVTVEGLSGLIGRLLKAARARRSLDEGQVINEN